MVAPNKKGQLSRVDRMVDLFLKKGIKYCSNGIHVKDVLALYKAEYPKEHLGENEASLIRVTLSHYRNGSPRRTAGTRIVFRRVKSGFYTLEDQVWADAKTAAKKTALEGRKRLALHLKSERSPLAAAFKLQLSHYGCEACEFDFGKQFGVLGLGFIEAHHVIPISEGSRVTCISDFRAVCSNCHSMLHLGGYCGLSRNFGR